MSIKARRIIAASPVKHINVISASDARHIQVLAISADLVIAESHDKAINMKRKALDWSLCVFVIGILLLAIAAMLFTIS